LGYTFHRLGRYDQAIASYRQSLTLSRRLGERYYETETLIHLGDACRAAGDGPAARQAWRQALAVLDGDRHPDARRVRARLARAAVS
jgi:tetratricopeptide (TPR) repeat protein